MIAYNINLNLKNTHSKNTYIELPMANRDSVEFNLYVYNDTEEIDYMSFDFARVVFQKSNGMRSQNDCFIHHDRILCQLKTSDYDVKGKVSAELWLYQGDIKAAPIPFNFQAVQSVGCALIPSDNQLDSFDALFERLQMKYDDFPNLNSLGSFPTLEELTAEYPNGTDEFGNRLQGGFFVISFTPPHFFTWSSVSNRWEDMGAITGESAYELAVENGFVGTVEEWLEYIKGEKGDTGEQGIQGIQGESAFEIAVDNGFEGTESEWLDSLKGDIGETGEQGIQGIQGEKGEQGDGLNIRGVFDSLTELQTAYPDGSGIIGGFIIGEDYYIWDLSTNAWKNAGKLSIFGDGGAALAEHESAPMPHLTADGNYKWGLRINEDLSATLIYETAEQEG